MRNFFAETNWWALAALALVVVGFVMTLVSGAGWFPVVALAAVVCAVLSAVEVLSVRR